MRPSVERLDELKRSYHLSSERLRKIAAAYAGDLGSSGAGSEGVAPIDEIERIMKAHSGRLAVVLEAIGKANSDPDCTGEAIQALEDDMPALEHDLRAMEALVGQVEAAVAGVRTERTVN